MTDASRRRPLARARSLGRLAVTGALLAGAVAAGLAVSPCGGRTVQAVEQPLGAGGEYHPLTPVRILDTRFPDLDVAPPGRKPLQAKDGTSTFDVACYGAEYKLHQDVVDFYLAAIRAFQKFPTFDLLAA